jgi:hypothetical protein
MTTAVKADLDKAVSAKRITSSQEHQILSMLSAHLNDLVNGTVPHLGRHGFAPRGAFGPDGPPPDVGGAPGAGGPPTSFQGPDGLPGASSGQVPPGGGPME